MTTQKVVQLKKTKTLSPIEEQHPHLYKKYIVEGESVELKTKIVK